MPSRPTHVRVQLLYVDSHRNDFAVFVCGGCKKPLPLPTPSQPSAHTTWDSFGATQKASVRAAHADAWPHVPGQLATNQDFSENGYAISPHQSDVQEHLVSPNMWHVACGKVLMARMKSPVTGEKRARESM